jgi:hypothetical protein
VLLLALLYHSYLEQTSLRPAIKVAAAVVVLVGILAQSGGFFLHMVIGQPGAPSVGIMITSLGAALLAAAIVLLVYGLVTTPDKWLSWKVFWARAGTPFDCRRTDETTITDVATLVGDGCPIPAIEAPIWIVEHASEHVMGHKPISIITGY